MSERIIVDLDRAGKLESEIEKKLQSGQSIGSVMDESLAVVKNEIFQTEELGGSATIDVDSIADGTTSSYTGASTTNNKVIAKQNTEEVVLDDIDYDASFRKMRDHKVDTIHLIEKVINRNDKNNNETNPKPLKLLTTNDQSIDINEIIGAASSKSWQASLK